MLKNHPYQYLYFNNLAGNNITNNFDLDYWGTSNKSALTYIAAHDKRDKLNIYVFANNKNVIKIHEIHGYKALKKKYFKIKNGKEISYIKMILKKKLLKKKLNEF